MSEPQQIISWFNTGTLALQALASLENEEIGLENEGEQTHEYVYTEEQSVSVEETVSLAPSLAELCARYANAYISDRLDDALHREMKSMADEIITQLPDAEREALIELIRTKWREQENQPAQGKDKK